MNVATLVREVERLEAKARPATVAPLDPVEFARSVGFIPDDWQRDVLEGGGDLLLNCARQSGKSSTAGLLAAHKALTAPGSLVLILGPSERQAKETFGKTAAFHRRLGFPVPHDSYRKMGMELLNGSRVEALPGTEKTVRGYSDVDLLIVDEAARVEDDLYYAVRPMLAVSGGRLILMSTPHGRRGVFHHEWTDGEGWERFEIPADECPRIPPGFLEAERRSMPEYWFAQEYECQFRDTEDQVFSSLLIEAAADTGAVAPTGGFEW